MTIEKEFFKKKKKKDMYLSLVFLLLVILSTVALFFYSGRVEAENISLLQQITERKSSIEKLREDKNIEAYYLYNLNRKVLDEMTKNSEISKFVEHSLRVMVRYDLIFENFTYNNGEVYLNAVSESNDRGLAYKKIIKFMNEYNKNETSLFHLEPINSFSGQDNIKFPVIFSIK